MPLSVSTSCIFAALWLTLSLPSRYNDDPLPKTARVLLVFTLAFLSLWNALVSFSTFGSSWNVKSRVKSAGKHSVIEEPSSSQSHRTCKFICIMSGTLQGPGSASPPLSWTEDSTRRTPFLLFCKSPPSLLALGLSLNSVWIDVVWIKIGLPSSVGEIPLQSNFKGI